MNGHVLLVCRRNRKHHFMCHFSIFFWNKLSHGETVCPPADGSASGPIDGATSWSGTDRQTDRRTDGS